MENSQQLLFSLPMGDKLSLTDLPEEILSIFSKYAQEPPPAPFSSDGGTTRRLQAPSSLKELSCTCKKMRRIAMPDLFEIITIRRLAATVLTVDDNCVTIVEHEQLAQRCHFMASYAKQLDLKTSYAYSVELRACFKTAIRLLSSLEKIYNMPRDFLCGRAMIARISTHPSLRYVEVSPAPMTGSAVDSRMSGDPFPCTSVYRYHLSLPRPPYAISLETYFPEIRNPGMRVLTLLLSPAIDDIEFLIRHRRVFPDLFALSLLDIRENDLERVIRLTDSFLQLNPTIKTLEFDSFDLFFEFAHLQFPPITPLLWGDYPDLKLDSSTWAISKTPQMAAECQKLAVYTIRELEMKESCFFFDEIRFFIPTLKELAIDLGYYVGRDSAKRLEDVLVTVAKIARSMSTIPCLWRLDVHCLLTEEQLKPIAFSVASVNKNLKLICFGRGLRPYDRTQAPLPITEAYIERGEGGGVFDIQIVPGQ